MLRTPGNTAVRRAWEICPQHPTKKHGGQGKTTWLDTIRSDMEAVGTSEIECKELLKTEIGGDTDIDLVHMNIGQQ